MNFFEMPPMDRLGAPKNDETVYASFHTLRELEMSVEELQNASFSSQDITTQVSHHGNLLDPAAEDASLAVEGAILGAAGGLVVGILLGLMTDFGSLVVPEAVLSPIVSVFASAVACGLLAGIVGGVIGLAIRKYEIKKYNSSLQNGEILVQVHAESPERLLRAKQILEFCGGKEQKPEQIIKKAS